MTCGRLKMATSTTTATAVTIHWREFFRRTVLVQGQAFQMAVAASRKGALACPLHPSNRRSSRATVPRLLARSCKHATCHAFATSRTRINSCTFNRASVTRSGRQARPPGLAAARQYRQQKRNAVAQLPPPPPSLWELFFLGQNPPCFHFLPSRSPQWLIKK